MPVSYLGLGSKSRLGIGAVLALVGVLGAVVGPLVGATALPGPWSFVCGFVTGILAGLGTTFVISGLIDRRRQD